MPLDDSGFPAPPIRTSPEPPRRQRVGTAATDQRVIANARSSSRVLLPLPAAINVLKLLLPLDDEASQIGATAADQHIAVPTRRQQGVVATPGNQRVIKEAVGGTRQSTGRRRCTPISVSSAPVVLSITSPRRSPPRAR